MNHHLLSRLIRSITIMTYYHKYLLRTAPILIGAFLLMQSQELMGQASGKVPTEISQDIEIVNSAMEYHNQSFQEYTRDLLQYRDNLRQISEYMQQLRPNTTQYIVAAEAYESEFSNALRVQYDYVLTMIRLRQNTVAALNKMKRNYLSPSAIQRRYDEAIRELNHQIRVLEQQLISMAVLEAYGKLSNDTLTLINQKMSLLYFHEIPNTKQELDYFKTDGKELLFNPNQFEAIANQLDGIQTELLKLTSGAVAIRTRIQTIAAVMLDLAEKRLSHRDLWITNQHLSELATILDETGREIIKIDRPDVSLFEPESNSYERLSNPPQPNYNNQNINSHNVLQHYRKNN